MLHIYNPYNACTIDVDECTLGAHPEILEEVLNVFNPNRKKTTAAQPAKPVKAQTIQPEEIFKAEELGLVEKDGQIMVSSRAVAKAYEKQHSNLLYAIRMLECSEHFREFNFKLASYVDKQGKDRPEYFMTKDGFTFLVMGFTGKLAAKFKEAYINAFNTMEAMLRSKQISA